MTSTHPYLLRALYDWILDNNMTPQIMVQAGGDITGVPARFIEDGKVVLNISPLAVHGLVIGNDYLTFNARFDGVAGDITIPVLSVLAVYARENGRGMILPEPETEDKDLTAPAPAGGKVPAGKKARLTIVK